MPEIFPPVVILLWELQTPIPIKKSSHCFLELHTIKSMRVFSSSIPVQVLFKVEMGDRGPNHSEHPRLSVDITVVAFNEPVEIQVV